MEVNTTSTADPINMYNYLNNYILNPVVFIIIILIIIAYLVIFSSLGNNETANSGSSNNDNSYGQSYLGMFVIIIFVILILINGFQYFFNINITAYLKNLFTDKPEIKIIANQNAKKNHDDSDEDKISQVTSEIKKQVFNIPGNHYNYNDAKAICSAYGANLATYQQIESAYKNGGEWCNYGWSDGQMALFPTQQKTYDTLQTIEGHSHDCGRPGINGGYIANPEIKYGVNCYGIKPKITQDEEEMMKTLSPYPKTMKDIEFQKKVDHWKSKTHEIMLSPFNYNMWGEV